MALIKCFECGRSISELANDCPHCGAPQVLAHSVTQPSPPQTTSKKKSIGVIPTLAAILVTLLAVSYCTAPDQQERQNRVVRTSAETQKQTRQQEFRNDRTEILARIESLIAEKKYAQARATIASYLDVGVNDATLRRLNSRVEEEALLDATRNLPASDLDGNFSGYAKLARLDPQNATYTQRRNHYERLIKERNAAAVGKMRVGRDDVEGITWYEHPTAPGTFNKTWLVLYIGKRDGQQPWLRLRFQYASSDWLFINGVTVVADGTRYDLNNLSFDRDNSSTIWEWHDRTPTPRDIQMLEAVARSREATIRYRGQQYVRDIAVSAEEKRAIRETLAAHMALRAADQR